MTEEQVIRAIRDRAANPATRTDYAAIRRRDVPPPPTQEAIQAGQRAMGFALYPLHRRLFEQVGNGGFGPGDGLIGLPGGSLDVHGHSILELRNILRAETPLPAPVVPLCDWGDGIYSCIDSEMGGVLTVNEFGIRDTEKTFSRGLKHGFLEWTYGDVLLY
jgi:hypothetical protein